MDINKFERFLVEGKLLEKIYLKLKKVIVSKRKALFKKIDGFFANRARKRMEKETEIDPKKILFVTSRGGYNCNPKAIVDEIIRRNLPWKLVWVARSENMKNIWQYPKELEIVIRGSYEFYHAATTAKIWIDNSVNLSYLGTRKRNGQILIETWHGSLGLKRFETTSDKYWIKKATACGERTDYCISNSDFEDNLFKNSFWKSSEILKYGHPRNDILLTKDSKQQQEIVAKIRKIFGLDIDVKIALYAPTFRDTANMYTYMIDYEGVYAALQKRFGGKWRILTRLHFSARKQADKLKNTYPDFVIDATNYEDIQDLLLATDVGITDYSSWICDFVLTRRPGFIFATDMNTYVTERGFYYPLTSTPFPIAENNEELVSNILSFDEGIYQKNVDNFLQEKGCIDDGYASQRVVDKIMELMGEGK